MGTLVLASLLEGLEEMFDRQWLWVFRRISGSKRLGCQLLRTAAFLVIVVRRKWLEGSQILKIAAFLANL